MTYTLTRLSLLLTSLLFIGLYIAYLVYEFFIIKTPAVSSQALQPALISWGILAVAIGIVLAVKVMDRVLGY